MLFVLSLLAVPPVLARVACVGDACGGATAATPIAVPFCGLPADVRTLVANGFRNGRSPDVLGVAATTAIAGAARPADDALPWPQVDPVSDARVPIAFLGTGVAPDGAVPDGTGLDQIAPTLADLLGLRRPHPEVRAGVAIPGLATGDRPRLIVEVVWRGVGTTDLRAAPDAWPFLHATMHRTGDGTLEGTAGSIPLDPAATLTTIGTGGLPSQHGITGSTIRDDTGRIVSAWGPDAPTSIVSTLPDDLGSRYGVAMKVGLVAPDVDDRGLIGNGWAYPTRPRYDLSITQRPLPAVRALLDAGYGSDDVPDVLGVVLDGSIDRMDAQTAAIVRAAGTDDASVTFLLTATGTSAPSQAVPAAHVVRRVNASVQTSQPVVAAAAAGGLFLDQRVLAENDLTSNAAAQAMRRMVLDGENLFADAFPSFAVSFARYC